MPDKPLTRSGYTPEETEQVIASTLSIAVTLGDLMDEVCVVGGLVPTLLIDHQRGSAETDGHCGTNDLDVGLALALLDDARYKEISARLRQKGFEHDKTPDGKAVLHRWKMANLNVTVDFLIPPVADEQRGGKVKHLEPDFGALVAPGLGLAFEEREWVQIDGVTLAGDRATRRVPVCGPAAFVVLKALAFRLRGEQKDAYDLDYVLENWPGGVSDIAERMARHAQSDPDTVTEALGYLEADYASIDHVGPRAAARFLDSGDEDAAAADARGRVDDLLSACGRHGIRIETPTDDA